MQLYLNFKLTTGTMGDGGPLQIACFVVGAVNSCVAIHATMVPDCKKMDMALRCRSNSQVGA